ADLDDRIVACEMGSKSAVIVCADARLDLAVNAALISAFKTSGQRCVSAGRVLVHESLVDRFTERLASAAKRLRIGDPLDAGNFTGPVINTTSVKKVESYNRLARQEGASILLEGGKLSGSGRDDGCFLAPFLYRIDYRPDARCIREEVF